MSGGGFGGFGDDDDPSDDPFFSDDPVYPGEHINSFDIDQQADWLEEHGYEPGDYITVTWESADGETYQTEIALPEGDWDDPESWSDFYDDMRDFYEDIWDGEEYEGEATAA